jgi:hypothetical protein
VPYDDTRENYREGFPPAKTKKGKPVPLAPMKMKKLMDAISIADVSKISLA